MIPDKLILKIISPQGVILEKEDLSAVNIPLLDQYPIGIHPGHAPLIAETSNGTLKYRTSGEENEIEIYAGVLKIRNNIITILTSGEVSHKEDELYQTELVTYDRLMKTLIENTFSAQEAELGKEADGQ